jgi:hypothetical protein
MWGIAFEKPYVISEQGNRQVRYVSQSELSERVSMKYKKFSKETEVEVNKTDNSIFDIQQTLRNTAPKVIKVPEQKAVYKYHGVFAIDKKDIEDEIDSLDDSVNTNPSDLINLKFEQAKKNNAQTQEKLKREKAEQVSNETDNQEVEHGPEKV